MSPWERRLAAGNSAELSKQRASNVSMPATGADDVRVIVGKKEYSPIEICSFVLKQVKQYAERQLNASVESAVVALPRGYSAPEAEALRVVGDLAGLRITRVLEESVAAAIACARRDDEPRQVHRLLVHKMGAEVFHASVVLCDAGETFSVAGAADLAAGDDRFTLTF